MTFDIQEIRIRRLKGYISLSIVALFMILSFLIVTFILRFNVIEGILAVTILDLIAVLIYSIYLNFLFPVRRE